MNDQVVNELKRVVERAVRPLRAGDARKLRMREELLDHLAAIYQEEEARLGDEEAALARARQRFGDPGRLTEELQDAISWLEYVRYGLDRYRYRPGEPLLRLGLRHLLLSSCGMVAMFLMVLPMVWMRGRFGEIGTIAHVALVTVLFSTGFSLAVAVIAEQMGQALYGRGGRSPRQTLLRYGMASLLVFPLVTAFTYGALMLSLGETLRGFLLGSTIAPGAPLLFFLMAQTMKDQISRESQWQGILV